MGLAISMKHLKCIPDAEEFKGEAGGAEQGPHAIPKNPAISPLLFGEKKKIFFCLVKKSSETREARLELAASRLKACHSTN